MKLVTLITLVSVPLFGQGFPGSVSMPLAPANLNHAQHTKNWNQVLYNGAHSQYGPPFVNTLLDWGNRLYDYIQAGTSPSVNPTNTFWTVNTGYTEFSIYYVSQWWDVLNMLQNYPFNYAEDVWLHWAYDANIQPGQGTATWTYQSAWFDYASGPDYDGVYNYNGTTWVDHTQNINRYYGNPMTIANNTQEYFGSSQPYDQINFIVSTPRAGGSATFQYWNGTTWANLTTRSDTTNGLTASGQVLFNPPADWKRYTGVGLYQYNRKYWTRVAVTGTSTAPQYTSALGKDWSTGVSSGNNVCGYALNPSPDTRINIGTEVEYNPTPPAAQSCNFRYQSRVITTGWCDPYSGFGQPLIFTNYGFAEPDGTQPLALILSYAARNQAGSITGQNGVMFDDFFQSRPQPEWALDLPPGYINDVAAYKSAAATVLALRNLMGNAFSTPFLNGFQVGTNMGAGGAPSQGGPGSFDWNICEGTWCFMQPLFTAASSVAFNDAAYNWPNPAYDRFLPSINPAGQKLLMTCVESFPQWSLTITGGILQEWHPIDKGNRNPLNCLAMHLLGRNENTGLSYYVGQSYYYSATDEVYAVVNTDTLSVPPPIDTTYHIDTDGSVTGACCNNWYVGPNQFNTAKGQFCRNSTGERDYNIHIGDLRDGMDLQAVWTGANWQTLTVIAKSWPVGSPVSCIGELRLSTLNYPIEISQVWGWETWWPARAVDVGDPDPNGYRGGARAVEDPTPGVQTTGWLTGAQVTALNPSTCGAYSQCSDVWRRDYTKAIVLLRVWARNGTPSDYQVAELDTPSQPIQVSSLGPYTQLYPLQADGFTGPAVTQVQLRGNEAAILMKAPIIPTLAAPIFSPTGPYTGPAGPITISTPSAGATILYCVDTTNTCTPGTAGPGQTSNVGVQMTTNGFIRAMAIRSGANNSPISSWQGTIIPSAPWDATPICSGSYNQPAENNSGQTILTGVNCTGANAVFVTLVYWTGYSASCTYNGQAMNFVGTTNIAVGGSTGINIFYLGNITGGSSDTFRCATGYSMGMHVSGWRYGRQINFLDQNVSNSNCFPCTVSISPGGSDTLAFAVMTNNSSVNTNTIAVPAGWTQISAMIPTTPPYSPASVMMYRILPGTAPVSTTFTDNASPGPTGDLLFLANFNHQ